MIVSANLQDGQKTRFPLFFNGQLLSFEKDLTNATSQLIDLDAVLFVFINGVLQNQNNLINLRVDQHSHLQKHQILVIK